MLCIAKKHVCDQKSHNFFYYSFRLFVLIVVGFKCLSISDDYNKCLGVECSGQDAGIEFAKILEACG